MDNEKQKNNYNQDPNVDKGNDDKGHNGDHGNHGGHVVKPTSNHSLTYIPYVIPCVRN